jgi:hypothetical protein
MCSIDGKVNASVVTTSVSMDGLRRISRSRRTPHGHRFRSVTRVPLRWPDGVKRATQPYLILAIRPVN